MATKKTDKVAVEEKVKEPIEEPIEAPAEEVEEEPKRVRIKLPLIEGEDPEKVVGINGKYYKIRRGKWVDVPPEVAEVLDNSDAQMVSALEFQSEYEGKGKEFDW